jgi:hypothetical protein
LRQVGVIRPRAGDARRGEWRQDNEGNGADRERSNNFQGAPPFFVFLSEGDHQLGLVVRQSAFLESPPARVLMVRFADRCYLIAT